MLWSAGGSHGLKSGTKGSCTTRTHTKPCGEGLNADFSPLCMSTDQRQALPRVFLFISSPQTFKVAKAAINHSQLEINVNPNAP